MILFDLELLDVHLVNVFFFALDVPYHYSSNRREGSANVVEDNGG